MEILWKGIKGVRGMNVLKIGAVPFLNTKPLIYGLEMNQGKDLLELHYAHPALAAHMLEDGSLDLAILPSIEYARMQNLFIVPGISIAARGPVASVNLYCRKPLSEVKSIALDKRSRTSVALLKILCAEHYDISPGMKEMEPDIRVMLQDCDAALLIGDDALYQEEEMAEIRDLALDWFGLTSLPFVFAFWAGRQGAVGFEEHLILRSSLQQGLMNVRKIAANYPSPRIANSAELNEKYLTENIRYSFGENELDGLKLFYIKAWENGIIEGVPRFRFYET